MKKIILLFSLLFISTNIFAQDPILQSGNDNFEKEAYELTEAYNKQLVMRGKQIQLFMKKVEEFMIKRNKIENQFKGKEKLKMLTKLQIRETKEMSNILTQPQMEVYKRVKPRLQPLDVVK